jgi:hypothetical protein
MLSALVMTMSRTSIARLVVANSKALSRAGAARNMATSDTFHKKASVRLLKICSFHTIAQNFRLFAVTSTRTARSNTEVFRFLLLNFRREKWKKTA